MSKYQPAAGNMFDGSAGKESSVMLQYPMLTKSNFSAWSIKMEAFMDAQGLWDATEPVDLKGAVDQRKDKMARAVIFQAIPEDTLFLVAEKKTAKEVWEALKTMFLGADHIKQARIQTLKDELEALCMKSSDNVDEFAGKMCTLATRIRELGEAMKDDYVVTRMLRSLPNKFLPIVTTIEQFADLKVMSVEELIGRVRTYEERLWNGDDGDDEHLLLTKAEWQSRMKKGGGDSSFGSKSREGFSSRGRSNYRGRGRGRGQGGHGTSITLNQESNTSHGFGVNRDRSKDHCYNCGKLGHHAKDCRSKRRYEESNLMHAQEDEPALLLFVYEVQAPKMVMLNEEKLVPKLHTEEEDVQI
ncbi:uncharacterized protein LOC133929635 [Phragmites australis]|uniref:uncharacterized protein LOC133929635 n=1 Tax=Phragmites australis TaxID=29695 RepID=UPI002D79E8EE|nr:uncharacterized protein LOC133929635 [Phragmites australis]